jgi:predicted transcriptional regulator
MITEISEIKRIRKKLNLTQTELAKRAGVSQSLIAKVEAGRIDPTYSKTRKIFDALSSLSDVQEPKAKDLMNRKIISVNSNNSVHHVSLLMRKHNISQVPVMEKQRVAGLISETTILELVAQGKKLENLVAKEIMQEQPPLISANTPSRIVLELLRFSQMVLVTENGQITGVITKADVLKNL